MSNEDHGRFRVAKIGSADATLDTGEHTYVIKYHIDGVLTENNASRSPATTPRRCSTGS